MTYKHRNLVQVEFIFESKAERAAYYKSLKALRIKPFASKGKGLTIEHVLKKDDFDLFETKLKEFIKNNNGISLG